MRTCVLLGAVALGSIAGHASLADAAGANCAFGPDGKKGWMNCSSFFGDTQTQVQADCPWQIDKKSAWVGAWATNWDVFTDSCRSNARKAYLHIR